MPAALKQFLYHVEDTMGVADDFTDWGVVKAATGKAAAEQVRLHIAGLLECPMTDVSRFDGQEFLVRIVPCAGWSDHNVVVSDHAKECILGFNLGNPETE